ncbi:MAG: amidohydrolase [Candidatus Zixiibacteriota bacterium]|nr:MAG: amidohydrolase [candidate division Zixibacteria bacterium]
MTAAGLAGCAPDQPADLVLTGGNLMTMSPDRPRARALAIRDERLVFVGSEEGARRFIGPETRVVDLGKRVVFPGLVDAHGHLLSLGRSLSELSLTGTQSPAQIRQKVLEKQPSAPPGAWITGRGWDQNGWPGREFPTWRDLEGTEAHPVYLRRVDGHAAWVNRTALDRAGITRDTPDPPGGRLLRDARGEPTGVLLDNAADLVRRIIPEPSRAERLEWARAAIRECHRYGLTGMHDAGVDEATLEILRELRDREELTLRVYAMLDDADSAFVARQFAAGPQVDPWLTVRALKLYADGALGSRGAALLEPYSDDPSTRGLMVQSPDYLYRMTREALAHGFQVCTHAIGDAANRAVLDAYEKALAEVPPGDYRLRIEHCQVIAPDDFPRFGRLGLIASVQPTHATSDMLWAEDRLGPKRIKGAYAWRTLLQSGARLALGSDFPVESPAPLLGIMAAVARRDVMGHPTDGWHPEQRLTGDEAIRGFTVDAAWAGFAEGERGTLEAGKLADLTVMDGNLDLDWDVDLDWMTYAVSDIRVWMTVVGGKVVYEGNNTPSNRRITP